MTALPAGHFNMRNRGVIQEGYFADLVVIDPTAVRDKATYANPHQLAEGIRHVIVNGVQTLSDNKSLDQRSGLFLDN